jgi:hypothetical protein
MLQRILVVCISIDAGKEMPRGRRGVVLEEFRTKWNERLFLEASCEFLSAGLFCKLTIRS